MDSPRDHATDARYSQLTTDNGQLTSPATFPGRRARGEQTDLVIAVRLERGGDVERNWLAIAFELGRRFALGIHVGDVLAVDEDLDPAIVAADPEEALLAGGRRRQLDLGAIPGRAEIVVQADRGPRVRAGVG